MLSSKQSIFIVVILIACLGTIATDIYTPSISAISGYFHVKVNITQFSMAIFMISFAGSQLIYGPFSEVFGRRTPLLIGISIVFVGSLVCAFAPSIEILLLGRFIQGCGAGAGPLFRPIFRDTFTGSELSKYGSYAALVMIFLIPAAPMLGGYLQYFLGWRASFFFVSLYAMLGIVLVMFVLKETNVHHHKERARFKFIVGTFKELLSSRVFMGYAFCTFVSYGAFFSWFVTGPVLLIHNLGMTPILFGWLALFGGSVSMGLSAFINAKLVERFGVGRMLCLGWSVTFLSGVFLMGVSLFFPQSIVGVVLSAMLMVFGSTFIWPNIFSAAFTPFGHIAGYAGALYGFMQIGGGALMGSLMSFLPDKNPLPQAIVFMSSGLIAWGIYRYVVKSTA
jgi:Bcr/CflA subfamily drug resistance transporter